MSKKRIGGIALATLGLIVALGGGLLVAHASQYQPKVPLGTRVASVDVGGKTLPEARALLAAWWAEMAARPVALVSPRLSTPLEPVSAEAVGLALDLDRTVASLPVEDFVTNVRNEVSPPPVVERSIPPAAVYRRGGLDSVRARVAQSLPKPTRARVTYEAGAVRRTFESAGARLDDEAFKSGFRDVVLAGQSRFEIPLVEAPKSVPDEALLAIKEPVSSFTTRFNEGDRNRSANIRRAASKIDGLVLMPGDRFSFNGVVGRRTAENGYRLAGVFVNGQRDVDIGGGICQVSSTLYNSVLLADLKVVQRACHSLPVPYVPLGQDATVSYGAIDFAFQNSSERPVALSVAVGGGSITFRVLGEKEAGKAVSIQRGPRQSFARGTRYVVDRTLPPGKKVVEQPGASGHRITTYLVVTRDGVVERREPLGQSVYRGGVRVVRHNPTAATSATKPQAEPQTPPAQDAPTATPVSPEGVSAG